MTQDIPWHEIRLACIDSGNTLFGMDLGWVSGCLAERGVHVSSADLERADCEARPVVSEVKMSGTIPHGTPGFEIYLRAILDRLRSAEPISERKRAKIAKELAPLLDGPGQKRFLWARLLPGVQEALKILRAVPVHVVLVSNSDGTVEEKLERYSIRSYFDRVIDSTVVGVRKPDPGIFELALDGFGVEPNEAVHVGDFYHADVRGARNAGIHPILLDPLDSWTGWDCIRMPGLLEVARRIADSKETELTR